VSKSKPSVLALVGAFAAVYIIWGSTYLGIKYAVETLPPLLMAGLRFTIAGGIVYGFMRMKIAERPTGAQWRNAAIVGGLLLCGGNGLICIAQQYLPTGMTALLVATVPLWMVLIDWAAFRGRRPTLLVIGGLISGIAGVLVLLDPRRWHDQTIAVGSSVAVLIACVSWAIGSLFSRNADLPKSAFLATGMEMIAGGVMLIIAGSIRGEWASVNLDAVSIRSVLSFGYLVVFGSLIGFSAYIWLLQNVSAAAVSTYAYVNPIVAVLLGWIFLHEAIGLNTLIASALIIMAVLLVTLRKTKPRNLVVVSVQPSTPDKRRVLCSATSDG
jgi:drug/metabolite transporter (DMT)-like permease